MRVFSVFHYVLGGTTLVAHKIKTLRKGVVFEHLNVTFDVMTGGRGRMSSFAPWLIDFTSAIASGKSLPGVRAQSAEFIRVE